MCVVSNSMAFDPTRKGGHCADISSPLSGTSVGALKVLAVEWEWPKIVLGCLFCLSFFEIKDLDFQTVLSYHIIWNMTQRGYQIWENLSE